MGGSRTQSFVFVLVLIVALGFYMNNSDAIKKAFAELKRA